MNLKFSLLGVAISTALLSNSFAETLHRGTEVVLAFDQSFSSRTAHKGDHIAMHVVENVQLGNRVVIHRGAKVNMTIIDVQRNGRFGKNGQIKMDIHSIKTMGVKIHLQPRQKGNVVGGKGTAEAAGLAGAGAIVLGPIGLAAGYFAVGHSVTVKAGDRLDTEVSDDVHIR